MRELLNRLDKLLTIKSIVTIILTGIFAYLAVRGVVTVSYTHLDVYKRQKQD